MPHPEAPSHFEGAIQVENITAWDFWDRIGILLTGITITEVCIVTENEPGGVAVGSTTNIGLKADLTEKERSLLK